MKPLLLVSLFAICFASSDLHAASAARPNVLFIAIDDLNHWVGHLGRNPQTKTPNIDRLAKMGVTFTKAYCTAPACKPSRASLMSGMRPSTTGSYLNNQNWRAGISQDKVLNSHLSRAGYRTFGAGKIYHGPQDQGGVWNDYFTGSGGGLTPHPSAKDDGVGGIKFGPLANRDEEMPDYRVADYGVKKLNEKHDKPFFLAVGFIKPHLPFSVPKKWFDLFPLDSIQLPPHRADDLDDVPPAGRAMAKPDGDHAQIVKSGRWKEAVQAYLASIAFCDAQVGRVLDGIEKSAYRDNTIVVLWTDHGWSLGEKSHWRKFALWEEPTRTVMIWKAPGVTKAGGMSSRPVDYSCVFPTVCALTGLPLPEYLDGRDISPLLKNPQSPWELPAITTHGIKNHTVRTEEWRYIRYANGEEELYNSAKDRLEYTNLAGRPEYAAQKTQLAKWLPKSDAPSLPLGDGGEDEDGGGGKKKKGKKAKRK